MSTFLRTSLSHALLCAGLAMASLAHAQAPQLPSPDATHPERTQLMQGFPPPPDKVVRLATVLKYPNARWAFHHLRELGPTTDIWRGDKGALPLSQSTSLLQDGLAMADGKGGNTTLLDWQKRTYTDGLLVMHKGQVVYERYDMGMQRHQPHVLWSMSKSLTGLLATDLIREGVLDANASIASYLPELKDSAWGDATLQQTLDMTTSVKYTEDFTNPASGIFQYLIAAGLVPAPANYPGARSLAEFLPTQKKDGEHGQGFTYKTVDTEVVGWVMQRVTGKSFAQLMSERIWSRIGADEDGFVWADPSGGQSTSVGVSATLRDLGRLGEMLRQDGRVGGRQVVAPSTVAELRKGADPEKFKAANQPMRAGYSYHNHWWIPHDADGSYEAKGLNGQHIHINPKAELVIVKLSSHPIPNTAFTHGDDRAAFAAIAQAVRAR
ncbi:serine hydrolase [Acidovorax sp.]|uniref:serine hydrolase domain-containing protein n=1 Tax=Acidovorax sp. TaxID=1872122 RepID=UPI0026121CB1|nr:serine hydrolase [Acidovorax sp.]